MSPALWIAVITGVLTSAAVIFVLLRYERHRDE